MSEADYKKAKSYDIVYLSQWKWGLISINWYVFK